MTEDEFISLIDCHFPYHDTADSHRMIELGCAISPNAAFTIVYELARVPASVVVESNKLLGLLQDVESRFEHPLKESVIRVARRLISGMRLSLPEVMGAMRDVGHFRNQYQALNVIYSSGEEAWDEIDVLYKEITQLWKDAA